jgi:hypothetical protein
MLPFSTTTQKVKTLDDLQPILLRELTRSRCEIDEMMECLKTSYIPNFKLLFKQEVPHFRVKIKNKDGRLHLFTACCISRVHSNLYPEIEPTRAY